MDDRQFSLSQLSRACGRSKSTLIEMLRAGELVGERSAAGRQAWLIRESDALAAGLAVRGSSTIDDAFRACIHDEVAPVLEAIERHASELHRRIDELERDLDLNGPRTTDLAPTTSVRWAARAFVDAIARWLRIR